MNNYHNLIRTKGEDYISNKLKILYFITNEAYHLDYKDYNADVLSTLANSSQDNNIVIRMQNYYESLANVNVKRSDSLFLDTLYYQKTFDIGIILMLIVIVTLLFNVDYQSEMSAIITLSRTGKLKVLFWKYITGLLFAFSFLVILFVSNILILNFRFGFEYLETPIQAFYSYFSSPFSLNIFNLLIMVIFSKILFVLFVYSLLWLICIFINNSQIGVIIVVGLYLISMLFSIKSI